MPAASTTVRALLLGPARVLRVVAATPRALYLAPGDTRPAAASAGLVALLAPDAVRVPFGVVLDARPGGTTPHLASVAVGDEAVAGDGVLRLCGFAVRPLRWWDPGVPPVHVVATRVAADLAAHLPSAPPEVVGALPALANALRRVATGVAGSPRADLAAAVRGLVGRGPGLTPTGDDVLAGALCALAATRSAATTRRALADTVLAEMHRTTPVSAALLGEAVHGRAVPQLVDLLRTLGRPAAAQRVAAAVAALVGVGHTSGTALGHGLVLGLQAAAPVTRAAA